jgi:ribosomal protein S4E
MEQCPDDDDNIAVFEDENHQLHLIPCDESQKKMAHVFNKNCICQPTIELMDNEGKEELVLIHNKILH